MISSLWGLHTPLFTQVVSSKEVMESYCVAEGLLVLVLLQSKALLEVLLFCLDSFTHYKLTDCGLGSPMRGTESPGGGIPVLDQDCETRDFSWCRLPNLKLPRGTALFYFFAPLGKLVLTNCHREVFPVGKTAAPVFHLGRPHWEGEADSSSPPRAMVLIQTGSSHWNLLSSR